jgi:hypothetical protein
VADPKPEYSDDDLLLVGNALGTMPFDERIVRAAAVLDALLRAGWLPPSASRGLCGDRGAIFLAGSTPYSCDLLALHEGMHGAWNDDGVTRCDWWSCICPDVTRIGAVEPEVHAGGNPACPIHKPWPKPTPQDMVTEELPGGTVIRFPDTTTVTYELYGGTDG